MRPTEIKGKLKILIIEFQLWFSLVPERTSFYYNVSHKGSIRTLQCKNDYLSITVINFT
jgi:hypothetical protein